MSDKNDGGPAFPSTAFDNCALPGCEGGPMRGMTLHDWFAGMALQGLLVNAPHGSSGRICCEEAFKCADAMLEERSK